MSDDSLGTNEALPVEERGAYRHLPELVRETHTGHEARDGMQGADPRQFPESDPTFQSGG